MQAASCKRGLAVALAPDVFGHVQSAAPLCAGLFVRHQCQSAFGMHEQRDLLEL